MTRRARIEPAMPATTKKLRCAVYTRKSTDEGLEKEFNTLDAQRDTYEIRKVNGMEPKIMMAGVTV